VRNPEDEHTLEFPKKPRESSTLRLFLSMNIRPAIDAATDLADHSFPEIIKVMVTVHFLRCTGERCVSDGINALSP
jgi:hypothetical protein